MRFDRRGCAIGSFSLHSAFKKTTTHDLRRIWLIQQRTSSEQYIPVMPSRIADAPVAAASDRHMMCSSEPAAAASSTSSTSITLTFNGVSFRLTPEQQSTSSSSSTINIADDEANMISFLQGITGSGNSAQLSLKNFTGTLHVELAASTSSAAAATAATSSPITATSAIGGASRVTPVSTAITASNSKANDAGAAADEPSSILGHSADKAPAYTSPQPKKACSSASAKKTKQQGLLPFATATTTSTAGAKKKMNNSKKTKAGSGGKKVRSTTLTYLKNLMTVLVFELTIVKCVIRNNVHLLTHHPILFYPTQLVLGHPVQEECQPIGQKVVVFGHRNHSKCHSQRRQAVAHSSTEEAKEGG